MMVPQAVNSAGRSTLQTLARLFTCLILAWTLSAFASGKESPVPKTSEAVHPQRKNVLVLLPENIGFEGQMAFFQALKAGLVLPGTVELYTESVDLVRLKDPGSADELEKIYRAKYKHLKLDLVIVGQRPLLEFLVRRKQRLFHGVPVLFGMIPKDMPRPAERYPGVTGSVTALDYGRTVELALALQPNTKRVILISGASPRDKWLAWIARQQFQKLVGRVGFAYWEALTPAEVGEQFKKLSSTDVIFYLAESEDHEGRTYAAGQFLDLVAPHANVPIYGSMTQQLGHGVIGGDLYDNVGEASVIAEQGREVLAGKSPDEIPIAEVTMSPAVDSRELGRFRIPLSRVPTGTDVRFREPTLWEKHKYGIVAVITFITLETALIFLLCIEIRRKNRARRMVERRFAAERVLTEYSEKLTHGAPEDLEEQIQQGLAAIRAAKELDWALWFMVEPKSNEIQQSFLSQEQPSAGTGALRIGEHTPWMMEQVESSRVMAVSNVAQLPERATEDRSYLESLGVASILMLPSNSNGGARSALVLASRERGKEWPNALVARLTTLGNLFGSTLHRRRAEVELKDKKEWLEMALEASKTALWDLDIVSGKVRWSQRDDSLLGKTPVELELSWEKFLERVPEEDRDDLYGKTIAMLENREGNDTFLTEWRYHEANGTEKWVLFRGKVYRDTRGRPLRLRGVNVDITELKQAKLELVELTERLIQAQESERQRLARELHDDIGQRLSLLIIGLDRLRHGLPAGMRVPREELTNSLEEASQLARDIHGLSHQLHSSKLKHLGLKSALRELCVQVAKQHGVEVNLHAGAIPGEISEERALCLYRVAQEALNNAVKHKKPPCARCRPGQYA